MRHIDRVRVNVREFQIYTFGDTPTPFSVANHINNESREIVEAATALKRADNKLRFFRFCSGIMALSILPTAIFAPVHIAYILFIIYHIMDKYQQHLTMVCEELVDNLAEELADFYILYFQFDALTNGNKEQEIETAKEAVHKLATWIEVDLLEEIEMKLIKLWRRKWKKPDPKTGVIEHVK